MNRKVRYTIGGIATAGLLAAVLLLACITNRNRQLTACNDVSIEVLGGHQFVSAEEVKGYLDKNYGIYIGQRIDSVGLAGIEKMLDKQGAILKSEAWVTGDGMLHISITQREPVLRLKKDADEFYLDRTGYVFPAQGDSAADVPLVDGNIPLNITGKFKGMVGSEEEKKWVSNMTELVSWLKKSDWNGKIGGITVSKDGDIVMSRSDGRERFIFGGPDKFKEKFERMDSYMRYILPEKGEGYYASVNVKYDRQIICRQK